MLFTINDEITILGSVNDVAGRYKMGNYWNDSEKLQIAQRIMMRAVNEPRLTPKL